MTALVPSCTGIQIHRRGDEPELNGGQWAHPNMRRAGDELRRGEALTRLTRKRVGDGGDQQVCVSPGCHVYADPHKRYCPACELDLDKCKLARAENVGDGGPLIGWSCEPGELETVLHYAVAALAVVGVLFL